MTDLIEELKSEHRIMLEMLNGIKATGISSKTGQEKLKQARDVLLSHMSKEDERYYPALRKAAEDDKDLKIMLDYFVKDMEFVSKEAARLFDKYSEGGNESDFASDFKMLYVTLKDRIRTEEETLFQKFNPVAK